MHWRFSRFMRRFWATTRRETLFVGRTPYGTWQLEITARPTADVPRKTIHLGEERTTHEDAIADGEDWVSTRKERVI